MSEIQSIFWCERCLAPSTRPRITFREIDGLLTCNACEHAINKKTRIDWDERQRYFGKLCDKFRGNGKDPDVIIPWSGGKDSVYVAHTVRDRFGMTPLLVSVIPHLETTIGAWNRENLSRGFQKMEIELPVEKYWKLAKKFFIEQGRPKHPWETAISLVIINTAIDLGIPFIVYGEDGEMEYGGSNREKDRWKKPADKEYLMNFYWLNDPCWKVPENLDDVFFTQWSRFEDWSPTKHAEFAIKRGMRIAEERSIGTYTNTCQLSDKLQDLHAYLMFVKYGFGRCTSDACIQIREGLLDRDEALELVENYDGEFPNTYLKEYLGYFDMTEEEFTRTINKFGNRTFMENYMHIWYLKEWVQMKRRRGTKLELLNPNRFSPVRPSRAR